MSHLGIEVVERLVAGKCVIVPAFISFLVNASSIELKEWIFFLGTYSRMRCYNKK